MLDRLLYSDFQRRIGSDLTDKQKNRLLRTVRHQMNEVHTKNPNQDVQYLNKEVLSSVVPDYISQLRRQSGPSDAVEGETDDVIRDDVNNRFNRIQNERQEARAAIPPPPNFQVPLDEGPSPLSRFEEIRQQREEEAARVISSQPPQDIQRQIESDELFRSNSSQTNQKNDMILAIRDKNRAQQIEQTRNEIVSISPDPRRSFFGEGTNGLPPTLRSSGLANTNPTQALPTMERGREEIPLPQDILKPQDSLVSYRENEYNLFIYSGDRDWVNNNTENRYNFSVNFDPANNRNGFGFSPATNIKFKNITRIEFVKAIMYTEACDVLSTSDTAPAGNINTDLNVNLFSFPYLQVRIPELDTNGFGTNNGLDNAFAVISYDAYWSPDSNLKGRGYTRMIPKFLKCQRVFQPTPLATLQKMSIQLQRPDGSIVCGSPDTQDISGFYFSSAATASSNYSDASNNFIWIRTQDFFSQFQITQGDRVVFKNTDFSSAFKTAAGNAATTDFINFITRPQGHLVSDIGRISAAGAFRDGANTVGYANAIIIRTNMTDPTTGSTTPQNWGGSSASNSTFITQINANPTPSAGRFINMTRQIQLIFRVITRDMDSAARLRPDNL